MNNISIYILLFLNAVLSAFSQVLLKKSALKERKNIISQYINPYVISGYFIFFIVLIINIFAMRHISMSEVSIFSEAIPILISLFFGFIFFDERVDAKKIASSIIIIIGILIILV